MNNPVDVFNQKVKLICEYNNRSPLFVRLAGIEIEKNNLDHAADILKNGLIIFPGFAVAYFLLAKISTLKSNYSEALTHLKRGSELIHSPESFAYYLKEIDTLKKQRSFFNISRWKNFNSDKNSVSQDSVAYKSGTSKDEKIEETLIDLTKEIEGVTLSIKEVKDKIDQSRLKDELSENLIISETLARIYANQNEIQAAVKVYKKLIKKYPEKEDYFNTKINELKTLLKT